MDDLCRRIAEARGGDLVVRVEPAPARSASEAARLFGLVDFADAYAEIPAAEAVAVLVAVLARDLAYGCPLVPIEQAGRLAREFVDGFGAGARFFTNGDHGRPRAQPGVGPAWFPVTDATFDTGVLALASDRTGCAWFLDED